MLLEVALKVYPKVATKVFPIFVPDVHDVVPDDVFVFILYVDLDNFNDNFKENYKDNL